MTLGEKIHRLRAANKMTQAEFADACGVSVQAVQKWECDSYAPSLEKLTLLSRRFNISLDELVLDNSLRTVEEHRKVRLTPAYSAMHEWESYAEQLPVEYI